MLGGSLDETRSSAMGAGYNIKRDFSSTLSLCSEEEENSQ